MSREKTKVIYSASMMQPLLRPQKQLKTYSASITVFWVILAYHWNKNARCLPVSCKRQAVFLCFQQVTMTVSVLISVHFFVIKKATPTQNNYKILPLLKVLCLFLNLTTDKWTACLVKCVISTELHSALWCVTNSNQTVPCLHMLLVLMIHRTKRVIYTLCGNTSFCLQHLWDNK